MVSEKDRKKIQGLAINISIEDGEDSSGSTGDRVFEMDELAALTLANLSEDDEAFGCYILNQVAAYLREKGTPGINNCYKITRRDILSIGVTFEEYEFVSGFNPSVRPS